MRSRPCILVYHDPSPEIFSAHAAFLSEHYTIVDLSCLVDALETGDWSRVPAKAVAVTFDDGHKANFRLLGIFKRYSIMPTIYLCSEIVGTKRHFWWMADPHLSKSLKLLSTEDADRVLLERHGFSRRRQYEHPQALSLSEVREMRPYVSFQSHGRFHPILPKCTDKMCKDEIYESRRTLERLTGRTIDHFAYPNGDYGRREIEHVSNSGYRSARTCRWGWCSKSSDRFQLPAIGIDGNSSVAKLAAQITGLHHLFDEIRKTLPRRPIHVMDRSKI